MFMFAVQWLKIAEESEVTQRSGIHITGLSEDHWVWSSVNAAGDVYIYNVLIYSQQLHSSSEQIGVEPPGTDGGHVLLIVCTQWSPPHDARQTVYPFSVLA